MLVRPRVRRLVAVCAAATLAVSAVGACSSASGSSSIKIGLLASLSGVYKAVGTDLRDGFQLYLDTHDGKLGGRSVDLVVADEGDGPATAVPAATKLIKQDRVQVLTGIVGSGSVAAVVPIVNENKIPFIGSNGRPELPDISRVWHTSFMTEDFGTALGKYVQEKAKGPVYAIGADYQAGYEAMRGFEATFTKAGGQLANPDRKPQYTPFPTTTNFLPYLSKIKSSGAKAVYSFYAGAQAVDFVKQYRQSDAAELPLYSGGALTEGGVLSAQGEAATGIQTTFHYAPNLDNATNRAFVAAWDAKHPGVQPTSFVVASYDAAAVLDRALAAAGGSADPEGINKAIAGLGKIDSPRGEWQLGNKTHAPVQKWYLREVKKDGRGLSNVVVQDLATLGS